MRAAPYCCPLFPYLSSCSHAQQGLACHEMPRTCLLAARPTATTKMTRDTGTACVLTGVSGLMETQEFYQPGVAFMGAESYGAATLLLTAKAFLSLLLGLSVTYAWVVLPQVGKAAPEHAPGNACDAQVGKAQEGMAHQDHPSAQSMFGPVGRLQMFNARADP